MTVSAINAYVVEYQVITGQGTGSPQAGQITKTVVLAADDKSIVNLLAADLGVAPSQIQIASATQESCDGNVHQ